MKLRKVCFLIPRVMHNAAAICIGVVITLGSWGWFFVLVPIGLVCHGLDWLFHETHPWTKSDINAALRAIHQYGNLGEHIRICLYARKIFSSDKVRQVTPYALCGTYGSGRKGFRDSKGIVGLCFRTQEACVEEIPAEQDFRERMKNQWGFDDKDVNQMQGNRKSYMCVPIMGRAGKVIAAIFLDSTENNAFTDELKENLSRTGIEIAKML